MRRVHLGALSATIALALGSPALAADRVEPLNQYTVQGDTDELAQLGYDVVEGDGKGIVATPSQADALRGKGFDRRAVGQGEHDLGRGGHDPAGRSDLGLRRLPAVEPQAGAVPDGVLGR